MRAMPISRPVGRFRDSGRRSPLLLCLVLTLPAAAAVPAAPSLFLVDTPFAPPMITRIYIVEPVTGEMTLRADLGSGYSPVFGLAAASASLLYATGTDPSLCPDEGGVLLRIVLAPGTTVPQELVPVGCVLDGAGPVGKLTGLSFRADGVLYAASQDTDGLYLVDTSTAGATLVGVADVDIHGGDIHFDEEDRLFLWTNLGPAAGLYELDAATAEASAFDLRPHLIMAGLAGPGHSNLMRGASPPVDRLYEISSVTGLTGIQVQLALDGQPFDHVRGDLDSPYCDDNDGCADGNECTDDVCSPGGCRHLPADPGSTTCGTGACQRTVAACADGVPLECVPGQPSADDATCDGMDDDCDGAVDEDASAPATAPLMVLDLSGGVPVLAWSPVPGASGYDVVQGDAFVLHASGGEFAVATTACTANDLALTQVAAGEPLEPGEVIWYLIRPTGCGGQGSYDVPAPSQVRSRDPGIAGAAAACP